MYPLLGTNLATEFCPLFLARLEREIIGP